MNSINQFQSLEKIQHLLTDIDETMTSKDKISAWAFVALEQMISSLSQPGTPAKWGEGFAEMVGKLIAKRC